MLGWDIEVCGLRGLESGGEIQRCLARKEVAVSIDGGRRGEGVLAMLKHGVGVGRSEATRFGVEVKEDGVRLPVAEGADGSLVNTGDEEGGGAPGPEAVGFDTFRGDVGDMVDNSGSAAECGCDVVGRDIVGRPLESK